MKIKAYAPYPEHREHALGYGRLGGVDASQALTGVTFAQLDIEWPLVVGEADHLNCAFVVHV